MSFPKDVEIKIDYSQPLEVSLEGWEGDPIAKAIVRYFQYRCDALEARIRELEDVAAVGSCVVAVGFNHYDK